MVASAKFSLIIIVDNVQETYFFGFEKQYRKLHNMLYDNRITTYRRSGWVVSLMQKQARPANPSEILGQEPLQEIGIGLICQQNTRDMPYLHLN